MTGPKIGASSSGTPIRAMTRPIRCGPAARASIVWPSGMIMPAPRPCTTRKAISAPIDHDRPASSEPAMNIASDAIHSGLAPKRCPAQPLSGITLANASM
jgi:hypothetical protein